MKKGKIHKALSSKFYGIYDLCSSQMSNSRVTYKWNRVTCKNCLRMKGKNRRNRKWQ